MPAFERAAPVAVPRPGCSTLALGLMAALAGIWTPEARALPIGFYMNQGNVDYDERVTDHFLVYHDRRVPGEGAAAVNALEAARPHLERWLGVHRERPLPVILSAVTEGASFANFITDTLEVQSFGQPSRDLLWHEYTHSTMYRHFDNLLGPAGSILHLPWLPTWFIEGVAELTSASVGSDYIAGVERYQALTGQWPSFASLHSLYRKATPVENGYATSAALVRYMLRQGDPARLPAFLENLYWKSMPWWWPYSVVPFADSLPFDRALQDFIGMNSEELYASYQTAAKAQWEKGDDRFLIGEDGPRRGIAGARLLKSNGREMLTAVDEDGDSLEATLEFSPETGWATGVKDMRPMLDKRAYTQRLTDPRLAAVIWYDRERQEPVSNFVFELSGGDGAEAKAIRKALKRRGYAFGLTEGETHLVWLEQQVGKSRLCRLAKTQLSQGKRSRLGKNAVRCQSLGTTPASAAPLGTRPAAAGAQEAAELWLVASEEQLSSTRYRVQRLSLGAKPRLTTITTSLARPLAAAFAGHDVWLLLAEQSRRTLRLIDAQGQCVSMIALKDHVVSAHGLTDGSLVVGLYGGNDIYLRRLEDPRSLAKTCEAPAPVTSPLLYATAKTNEDSETTLSAALGATDPWQPATPPTPAETERLLAAPALDQVDGSARAAGEGSVSVPPAQPAQWRGRPVFLVPWIGAEDALGSQLGLLSVPLMDHLQNETVRVTLLYGFPSNFPYQDVSLTSTRFTPTLAATYYRQQTYNGRFRVDDDEVVSSYLDEQGVRLESDLDTRLVGGEASLGVGLKVATLKPYTGPSRNGEGTLVEPGANATLVHTAGSWSFTQTLSGRVAPAGANESFDYNQVGASTGVAVGLPIVPSRLSLGIEGSRTRGKKRRDFRELYRPLKTFIPGSGGGYNQNSYPLAGEGNGLFAPKFGDTQGRLRANWTVPVVRDVDKIFWIIYAERLDFTAFYNYGDAWTGDAPSRGWDRLLSAHGYNLDLQMESHGLRFNAGLGVGKVVGRDWESYLSLGFDAIL